MKLVNAKYRLISGSSIINGAAAISPWGSPCMEQPLHPSMEQPLHPFMHPHNLVSPLQSGNKEYSGNDFTNSRFLFDSRREYKINEDHQKYNLFKSEFNGRFGFTFEEKISGGLIPRGDAMEARLQETLRWVCGNVVWVCGNVVWVCGNVV